MFKGLSRLVPRTMVVVLRTGRSNVISDYVGQRLSLGSRTPPRETALNVPCAVYIVPLSSFQTLSFTLIEGLRSHIASCNSIHQPLSPSSATLHSKSAALTPQYRSTVHLAHSQLQSLHPHHARSRRWLRISGEAVCMAEAGRAAVRSVHRMQGGRTTLSIRTQP
jgi:hypothetical protein